MTVSRVARRLRADLSGLPEANQAHLRRIERFVWAAVSSYVATYALVDRVISRTVPARWRGPVRIGVVALSSVAATLGINKTALSRSAAFGRERAAAQEALRASEERLRAVVQNAPVILFATDEAGVFTLAEGRGLDALGFRQGEAVGQSVFDLYRDVPEVLRNVRRALAGEAFTDVVDVGDLCFETRYEPLRAGGRVAGLVAVATDITERVRGERAERERIKLDGALLVSRTVAHEINNALSPVTGYADLLAAHPSVAGDPALASYARLIAEASEIAAEKVRRLQRIVRLEETPSPLGSDRPVLDMDRSTGA